MEVDNDQPPPSNSPPSSTDPSPPAHLGPRARALNTVFTDALTHTLKTLSYSNFASCFPTPAQYVPKALASLHAQTLLKLETFARAEYDAILAEHAIVPALNDLDDVLAKARARKNAAAEEGRREAVVVPHELPAAEIAQAHLKPFLVQQRSRLNAAIQNRGAENERLAEEVRGQRKEIEDLLEGLEGVVRDLEGAAGELEGVREEVRGEGVGMEVDLNS